MEVFSRQIVSIFCYIFVALKINFMQFLKKLIFVAFGAFLLMQCQTSKTAWQKQLNQNAYYNIWHTGAAPAGTGANFFLDFNAQDPTLKVDSFIVNSNMLNIEVTTIENKTLIIGRHFTPPNFEEKESEIPEFYKSDNYNGRVKISVKGESFWIEIKSFDKREATQLPL